MQASMHLYMHTYMHVRIRICTYIYIRRKVYIYIHKYMYIFIYIEISVYIRLSHGPRKGTNSRTASTLLFPKRDRASRITFTLLCLRVPLETLIAFQPMLELIHLICGSAKEACQHSRYDSKGGGVTPRMRQVICVKAWRPWLSGLEGIID